MKTPKEIAKNILSEGKIDPVKHKELIDHARRHYSDIAPDLYDSVPHGQGHHDAAHDHVADNLSDHFHKSHPHVNFRAVAKHALKHYVDDDRAETRANEAKQKRREAARNKPQKPLKAKKEPEPWWKKAGYSVPMSKPRKGIGSH